MYKGGLVLQYLKGQLILAQIVAGFEEHNVRAASGHVIFEGEPKRPLFGGHDFAFAGNHSTAAHEATEWQCKAARPLDPR